MKINPKLVFNKVIKLSEKLLETPSLNVKKIPNKGGVYLIRRSGKIIYIGKAKNLFRRINSDHISGENKNSTSTVRRKITKKLGIPHGKKLREWMSKCNFGVVEINDSDLRSLVEAYLIYFLRKDGQPLLND